MARGAPDYLAPQSNIAVATFDAGSLLAGMGGFQPLDGKGRIYFLDTFQRGLARWERNTNGAEAEQAYLFTEKAFTPPFSVRLQASNGNVTGWSEIRTAFILTQSGRLGVETAYFWNDADLDQLIYFQGRNNSLNYNATLKINQANNVMQVRTPTGYVTVGAIPPGMGIDAWLQIKLVADFETGKYARLVVGDTTYDLTQDIYTTAASAGDHGVTIELQAQDLSLNADMGLLGYVILTTDEP